MKTNHLALFFINAKNEDNGLLNLTNVETDGFNGYIKFDEETYIELSIDAENFKIYDHNLNNFQMAMVDAFIDYVLSKLRDHASTIRDINQTQLQLAKTANW